MQNAQNLFNETAKFGNWEIDKKLADISKYKIGKMIVIALELAEEDSVKAYNVRKQFQDKDKVRNTIVLLPTI